MARALVTGAAGFVGANLVRRLLEAGDDVCAVVRPGSDLWRLRGLEGLEAVEVELRDPEAVEALLGRARPQRVFHLAAHGAYSHQRDARRVLETNVIGGAALIDAALAQEVEAFVNSGSSSEYGLKDHAPREDEAVEPNSAYAVGKVAAALYGRHRAIETGARVATLRLYSVYGPWEDPGRLIPTLAVRGLAGELPPLVDPRIARDFVYVDDVVDAYLAAADAAPPGAIYNVGTGVQTTLAEAVEVARELLAIEAEPEWGSMPDRSWDTTTWVADPTLIERDLAWRPRHSFRNGFGLTVAWLRESGLVDFYRGR